jgi:hypothetical protein
MWSICLGYCVNCRGNPRRDTAYVLHFYMCCTSLLHLFYITLTSLLHGFTCFTSLLHVFYITLTCVLHVFYITFTSLLHVFYITFTFVLHHSYEWTWTWAFSNLSVFSYETWAIWNQSVFNFETLAFWNLKNPLYTFYFHNTPLYNSTYTSYFFLYILGSIYVS